MEEVSYQVISIREKSFFMLPPETIPEYENDEVSWNYTYSFGVLPVGPDKVWITIHFTYRLYCKNDPAQQTIVSVETETGIETQRHISTENRAAVIHTFLPQAVFQLQGIYAARTGGTPVSHILPVSPNFSNDTDFIKKQVHEIWK